MTPMDELHWTWGQYTGNSAGCSDVHAGCRKPMPDARYTPDFWSSVASVHKDDPTVVFDLFNEPYPDLVDAVRAAGAQNPILAGGPTYSNDLGRRLRYEPHDAAGNLAAAWHVYNFNVCANEGCWNSTLAPVAAEVPVIAGEIGEDICSHGFADRVMQWFGDHGLSCPGWTWNTWDRSSGPSLISDYDGTPTPYGIGLRDHLRALDS